MTRKLYSILFAFLFLSAAAYSQVTITLPGAPESQFFIDDINTITLLNGKTTSISGYLTFSILQVNQANILTVQTPVMLLQPASITSLASNKVLLTSTINYGSNSNAIYLKQSGQLYPGEYIFTGTFFSTTGQILGIASQEKIIKPMYPPKLTYPQDAQTISTLYPVLSWTAPGPLSSPNITYHLRLVQVQSDQSKELAFNIDAPIIDGNYANSNSLSLPPDAQPLAWGQTYAWQVSATEDGYNLGVTELWTFTPQMQKEDVMEAPLPVDSNSYPVIKRQLDGGFYVAKGFLRFAYTNSAGDSLLNYTIYHQGDMDSVQFTQQVIVSNGLNQVALNIGASNLFTNDEYYLLDIEDLNRVHYLLSFIYQTQ